MPASFLPLDFRAYKEALAEAAGAWRLGKRGCTKQSLSVYAIGKRTGRSCEQKERQ
jgi:hypothetical protein